jgi:hypothetical protein
MLVLVLVLVTNGLIIGFTEHLQLVNTSKFNAIISLHT